MMDLPHNLVSAIGKLNGACTKANVSWQILKYPGEMKYTALLTEVSRDRGPDLFEAEYIDDLLPYMIEQAEIIARSN